MLARQTVVRAAARAAPAARNMATLREIEMRLKSVKNIEKITKVSRNTYFWCTFANAALQSMKMIASTKLAKAQRAMQSGKEYGTANAGTPIPIQPTTLHIHKFSNNLPTHLFFSYNNHKTI